MLAVASLLLSVAVVVAFGGSNPSVMGHSALELIVNSSSIVDNSVGAADIDSTSLASECSSITGGASLCDGSDQDTDTDQQSLGTSGSSITLTNGGSVVAPDLSCTNCIGGTEVDESTLSGTASGLSIGGNAATATALGFASVGSTDVCVDEGAVAYCTASSCGDGTCDGCGAKTPQDLVWHFSGGRLVGTSQLTSAAC